MNDEKFTKTGKRKKHSVKKYLSTREMVTGVRKATNMPILQPVVQAPGDFRIYRPSKYDILCGRGKPIQDHTGNLRMRDIVAKYTDFYLNSRIHKKQEIVEEVVKLVKNSDGIRARFLKRVGRENYWVEVGDAIACDKVSHALRCMVRKGESSGPQEELDFGRQSASVEAGGHLAADTEIEEQQGHRVSLNATQDASNCLGERDLLLGIRGATSASGALGNATSLVGRLRPSTQLGKTPESLRSLLSQNQTMATLAPVLGGSLQGQAPVGALFGVNLGGTTSSLPGPRIARPLPVGGLPLTSVTQNSVTALAERNDRLIDLLARKQVEQEMSQMQQQPQLDFRAASMRVAGIPQLSVVNEELAQMQALEQLILQRRLQESLSGGRGPLNDDAARLDDAKPTGTKPSHR